MRSDGGDYHKWLDWVDGCPLCYNPVFDSPDPVLLASEKQAAAVVQLRRTLCGELSLPDDNGRDVLIKVSSPCPAPRACLRGAAY